MALVAGFVAIGALFFAVLGAANGYQRDPTRSEGNGADVASPGSDNHPGNGHPGI
jgi:hypothetical protein